MCQPNARALCVLTASALPGRSVSDPELTPRSITPASVLASTPRAGNARRLAPSAATTTEVAIEPDACRDARQAARGCRRDRPADRVRRCARSTYPAVVRCAVCSAVCSLQRRLREEDRADQRDGEHHRRRDGGGAAQVGARVRAGEHAGPAAERRQRQAEQPGERQARAAARAAPPPSIKIIAAAGASLSPPPRRGASEDDERRCLRRERPSPARPLSHETGRR